MSVSANLPDKPSQLLRLGLADLAKVEADPRFVVDMAGAVMAMTLGVDVHADVKPSDFDDVTRKKLLALDNLRAGAIEQALYLLGRGDLERPGSPDDRVTITSYRDDPAAFRRDLDGLVKRLEKDGL